MTPSVGHASASGGASSMLQGLANSQDVSRLEEALSGDASMGQSQEGILEGRRLPGIATPAPPAKK